MMWSFRIALEQVVKEHPHDARVHSALGLTYAYLGRQAAAVQQGMFAVEPCWDPLGARPVSKA